MNKCLLSAFVWCGLSASAFAQDDVPAPLLPAAEDETVSEIPAVPPPAAAPASASAPAVALPRVAVSEALVTVDGISRPDLGQSLSDTIAACLIESKQFEVLDFAASQRKSAAAGTVSGGSLPLIAPDGSRTPNLTGPEFLITLTIVGEKGDYRLTLRKQHVASGRIEAILRESVKGDTAALYKLVETATAKLIPPAPYKRRYEYVKMWLSPAPAAPPPAPEPAPRALPVNMPPEKLASIEAAKLQADRLSAITGEPERAGVIQSVSSQWSFVVIKGMKKDSVQPGDLLMTWSDRDPAKVHTIKVSAINGAAVVADVPEGATVLPGDKIYRWKTPVEVRPAE